MLEVPPSLCAPASYKLHTVREINIGAPHSIERRPASLRSLTNNCIWNAAVAYCQQRRILLIVDPPAGWTSPEQAVAGVDALLTRSSAAVLCFPNLRVADSLNGGQATRCAPCGMVAGVIARTDSTRGVWKAPAGVEAVLKGATGLVLVTKDSATARGYGIDPSRLARVLQGVHLHAVALRVEGNASMALAELITTQPIEETERPEHLTDIIDWIGWDRVMFASDYAHWDFDDPLFAVPPQWGEEKRTKIYSRNARSVFRF